MADNPNKPKSLYKNPGTQKTTADIQPGGQHKYDQMAFGGESKFVIHRPITGHTQKSNVKKS